MVFPAVDTGTQFRLPMQGQSRPLTGSLWWVWAGCSQLTLLTTQLELGVSHTNRFMRVIDLGLRDPGHKEQRPGK